MANVATVGSNMVGSDTKPLPIVQSVTEPLPVVVMPAYVAPVVDVAPVVAVTDDKAIAEKLSLWVMEIYREVGPEKGASIQEIIMSYGVNSITLIPADKRVEFAARIEQLRVK